MPIARINGVDLFYERTGSGERVVLVHGSWGDHNSWQRLVPLLAPHYEVVTFDRRGHSASERPVGQGCLDEDVEDLAGLIAHLGDEPVHVVGNSLGASITLRLAAARPELLLSATGHEPPLFSLLDGGPSAAQRDLSAMTAAVKAVLVLVENGAHEEAARLFVDQIAFGPGAWDGLPAPVRHAMVGNAPTFLDEQSDPGWSSLDVTQLAMSPVLLQVSCGVETRAAFRGVVMAIADRAPSIRVVELTGAGHVPHVTHPEAFADSLLAFLGESTRARLGGPRTGAER